VRTMKEGGKLWGPAGDEGYIDGESKNVVGMGPGGKSEKTVPKETAGEDLTQGVKPEGGQQGFLGDSTTREQKSIPHNRLSNE